MKMHMNRNGGAAFSANHANTPSAIGALLGDATAMINVWRFRRRERRTIRQLDDHMLRDIGMDRFSAEEIGARLLEGLSTPRIQRTR